MPRLEFKGRSVVWNHHLAVPYHELIAKPKKGLSPKPSLHDNLIIHGDNLAALKALLPTYAGKVKCIYIDPPYNTGNENWKYNDNVNSPLMKNWLGQVVGIDDEERHDKWLCMMTPRLKLLKELLREDGAIFVSIDHNEESRLRLLLDECFGEENFRNVFVVARVKKNIQEREKVNAVNYGYNSIMFYAKSSKCLIKPPVRYQKKASRWHAFDAPGIRTTMEYELFGRKPPTGRHWMYSKDRVNVMIKNGLLRHNEKSGSIQYLLEESDATLLDTNWCDIQEYDSKWGFPNGEKNVNLIDRIVSLIDEEGAVILDSFAGSGTTAHAVLALNKEDGGNRKFILVECEDYADSITAERVRRVIKGVPTAKKPELRQGLGGTFSYFELGAPIEIHRLLSGENLPSFEELARYVFFTATGEEIDLKKVKSKSGYLGSARGYDIYMIYQPDLDFLRSKALTLDYAKSLPPFAGRTRVVFAPARFLSPDLMDEYHIEFCQLPYELYRGLK